MVSREAIKIEVGENQEGGLHQRATAPIIRRGRKLEDDRLDRRAGQGSDDGRNVRPDNRMGLGRQNGQQFAAERTLVEGQGRPKVAEHPAEANGRLLPKDRFRMMKDRQQNTHNRRV
jgi:hypothetical protein